MSNDDSREVNQAEEEFSNICSMIREFIDDDEALSFMAEEGSGADEHRESHSIDGLELNTVSNVEISVIPENNETKTDQCDIQAEKLCSDTRTLLRGSSDPSTSRVPNEQLNSQNDTITSTISQPQQGFQPVDDFEGACSFGLIFPKRPSQKTTHLFISMPLQKVFIKLAETVLIQFIVDPTKAFTTDLYIRATLQYSEPHQAPLPVVRCTSHKLLDDPENMLHRTDGECNCNHIEMACHVVRSSTEGAIYCFDELTGRHSVMNPIRSRSHGIKYSFHCLSSCSSGINHRLLKVVFTLEDLTGTMYGQTSLNLKVTPNPKRDRDCADGEHSRAYKRKQDGSFVKIAPKSPSGTDFFLVTMKRALTEMRVTLDQLKQRCGDMRELFDKSLNSQQSQVGVVPDAAL